MDFGMPTLIETNKIEDCVRLCKELNLDFIELNMNLPEYQTDKIDIYKFKAILKNEEIYFTIHLDENLNVCDFNKLVADAYLETVLKTIDIAKELEVPVLNMHMSTGIYFTMPNEKIYLFNQYINIYLEKLKEFRDLCEKAIGNSGIKICIENTYWSGFDFMIKGIDLLLESEVFALTFDIGHNCSSGGADEEIICKHKNKLYHMHVHDAVGKKNHLALGTGELDIKRYLDLAKECSCRVVLETKTAAGLKESAAKLSSYNK